MKMTIKTGDNVLVTFACMPQTRDVRLLFNRLLKIIVSGSIDKNNQIRELAHLFTSYVMSNGIQMPNERTDPSA